MDYQIQRKEHDIPTTVEIALKYFADNNIYNSIVFNSFYPYLSNEENINYNKYLVVNLIWIAKCDKKFSLEAGSYLAAKYLNADELTIMRAIDKIELNCVYNKPLD
jgi:hypothetical protein